MQFIPGIDLSPELRQRTEAFFLKWAPKRSPRRDYFGHELEDLLTGWAGLGLQNFIETAETYVKRIKDARDLS